MDKAQYIYPRTKFVDENTLPKQLIHINQELTEITFASNITHETEEVCDLIHAAETYLRIMAEKHGLDIAKIQKAVIQKNKERGYYREIPKQFTCRNCKKAISPLGSGCTAERLCNKAFIRKTEQPNEWEEKPND